MAKKISSLSVILGATTAPFEKAFRGAGSAVTSLQSKLASAGKSILKFTGIAAGLSAIFGVLKGATSGVRLAAEMEQLGVAFEVMLGSADRATQMIDGLKEVWQDSIFDFNVIVGSAKTLMGYGHAADTVNDKLVMLSDIASATNQPLQDIVDIYGKMSVEGRIGAERINQMLGRGIPIVRELSKVLGVAESDIRDMTSRGEIHFSHVEQAIANLTNEGGQFAGMTEKMSKTLAVRWSWLMESIQMATAGVFKAVADAFNFSGIIATVATATDQIGAYLTDLVQRVVPIIVSRLQAAWAAIMANVDILKGLGVAVATAAGAYVAWRAALIASAVAMRAAAVAGKAWAATIAGINLANRTVMATQAAVRSAIMLTRSSIIAKTVATKAWRVSLLAAAGAQRAMVGILAAGRSATVALTAAQWLLNRAIAADATRVALAPARALIAAYQSLRAAYFATRAAIISAATATVTFNYAGYAVLTTARLQVKVMAALAWGHRMYQSAIASVVAAKTAMIATFLSARASVLAMVATARAATASTVAWRAAIVGVATATRAVIATQGLLRASVIASTAAFGAGRSILIATAAAARALFTMQGVWAVATKAVTAAQWLLNAALTANPIGLVVVAIGGLVAWLGTAAAKIIDVGAVVAWFNRAWAIASYAVTNWKETLHLALVGAVYGIVRFANQVVHFIGTVIPDFLMWLGRNWRQVFTDILNATALVLVNLYDNITGFFKAVWSWLKGDGFNWQWTGLLEGFESTLEELPQIAERQIGPLEKSLGDQAARLGKSWSEGLAAHLAGHDKAVEEATGTIADIGSAIEIPEIEAIAAPDSPIQQMTTDIEGIGAAAKATSDQLQALFSGSAEAQRARFAGAFAARQSGASTAVAAPVPASATRAMRENAGNDNLMKQLIELIRTGTNRTLEDIRDVVRDGGLAVAGDI